MTGAETVRLSRDGIVDAYLRIADKDGTDEITLRRLGSELGVDPTAVYRHVRDKGEILALAADRVLAAAADGLIETGDWREDLIELYARVRSAYLSHPRALRNLQLSPAVIPTVQRLSNQTIAWLHAGGLDEEQAALAFELLETYTLGTALFDAGMTEEILDGWRRSYATDPDAEYTYLAATASSLYRDPDAAFAQGLGMLLDGIERWVGSGTT
jgi:AcrR family transcriptional regulator